MTADSTARARTKVIYFRESVIQSALADLITFGFLCGSAWFNYRFIGGSYFINAIILIMWMMFLASRFGNRKHIFTSREQVEEFLKSEFPHP